MPARPSYLPTETLQRARSDAFNDRAERDLWSLSFNARADDDITNLASLAQPPAFEPTPIETPDPLPIVVSDRPEAKAPEPFKPPGPAALQPQVQPMPQQTASVTTSAIPGPDLSPESGTPVRSAAEMSADMPAQTGDLRAYTRAKAASLGIDPDIAERVFGEGEGGFDDPVRQSDVVYQGQREQSYGPAQLNMTGGLGSALLRDRGIDARDPKNVYAGIDYALEHAAREGWGAFHGAARIGIGERQGIGNQSAPAARPSATTPAPAEDAATVVQTAGRFARNQGEVGKELGLPWARTVEICGPVAAAAFLRATGRHPGREEAEAMRVAQEKGYWAPGRGMGGTATEEQLLNDMGVATRRVEGAPDWRAVAADVQRGNPVIIDAGDHYMVAESYDAQTGQFDFGETAGFLRAAQGRTKFRPEELPSLSGPEMTIRPSAAIFLDNPQSPSPSVVAGRTTPTAGATPPADSSLASPAGPTAGEAPLSLMKLGDAVPMPEDEGSKWSPDVNRLKPRPEPVRNIVPLDENGQPGESPGTRAYWLNDMQRQPLGQQTFSNEYDPRDADSGPREGGRAPWNGSSGTSEAGIEPSSPPMEPGQGDSPGQYIPPVQSQSGAFATSGQPPVSPMASTGPVASTDTSFTSPDTGNDDPGTQPVGAVNGPPAPAEPESPLKPVWDAAGNVLGYVREAAHAVSEAAEPVVAAVQEVVKPLTEGYGQMASNVLQGRTPAGQPLGEYVTNAPAMLERGARNVINQVASNQAALGLEPMGGILRIDDRMQEIATQAARDLGREGDVNEPVTRRSVQDPAWRAANPELADEYDQLQSQYTLAIAGQVGDSGVARRVGEAARVAFGVSPNYKPPTSAVVQAAEKQGAVRGARLNQEVVAPASAVPGRVRAAVRATDDRAAVRWAEDMLTDAAGTPRLRENDPARPSTQSRVNSGSIANTRVTEELEPAIIKAGQSGLQDELPQHLEDMHARDILDDFYSRGHRERIELGEEQAQAGIARVESVVKQRLEHAERQAKEVIDRADAVAKESTEAAEKQAKDVLDRANIVNRERLNASEKHAADLERAGRQNQAERVRRDAEANASQVLARAEERANVIRERAQSSALPAAQARAKAHAETVLRQAQDNASQTMTRAQEEADRLRRAAEQDAHRAGEARMRTRQGNDPSMSYEAIDARLQGQEARLTADGRWQQLQESAQAVWDHNAQTRQRLVDAGELDADEAAKLAERYPHYVPTVPISHLDGGAGSGAVASSAGPTVSRGNKPVVRALDDVGTSGERLNPIVASRNSTVTAERAIQKNNVVRAFAQMMDDALQASPGTMGVDQATHRTFLGGGKDITYFEGGKPVTLSVPAAVADGLNAAAEMGTDPGAIVRVWKTMMGVVTSAMTAGRASFLPVNLLRDAQDYATRTAALEGGGAHKIPGVMGTWFNEAGKAVADIARAQLTTRGTVGAVTGFAGGAAQGDENTTIGERLVHGVEGAVAGTFLVGANKVKPTGKAAEYIARGGGSGGVSSRWQVGQRWYREVMREGGAVVKTPQDAARYLGDWLQDIATLQGVKGINERSELISRTAAMRRGDKQGLDSVEAMIRGRDASYDPDRAGTVARMLNGIVPFFNASVQGAAQTARLFRQNPVAATATIASTLAPVMLGVEAWNRSDPDRAKTYDDVPQYIKDSGLVVVMPWAGSDARGERPNYLWIPTGMTTPFVVGMRTAMEGIPGLEPTAGRVGSRADAGTAERWADTLATVASIFSPVRGESPASMASAIVPQGAKQIIELGINKDLYRGGQIVSDSADERASAASRKVAEGANWVGRTFGNDALQEVRPSGVEHLVRSLPAYGDIVTGASDMVAPSGYKQAEDRPVQNEPFVGSIGGRFIRDTGGANLQRAQDERLPEVARSILEEAGMRPSDVGAVPSKYRGASLSRAEQEQWQAATNVYLAEEIATARDSAAWDDPSKREESVRKAITRAQNLAARDVLTLTPADIRDRTERDQAMKVR